MTRPRIALDVHAHLIPVDSSCIGELTDVSWDGGAQVLRIDGQAIGMKPLFRPEALIEWMDVNNVQRAWISLPPPAYRQGLDAAHAAGWADYVNQGLSAIASRHRPRLEPLFHLPVEHPEVAARIAVAMAPSRFAIAAGGETALCYSDARLEPLWTVLNNAGAFVFLHPGHCCDERLGAYYLDNLLGNPHETAVAVGQLVFGGVIDRFPAIRFCLAHGGGTVPMLAGRWQRGFDTGRPGLDTTLAPPLAALRRFRADCLTHDPKAALLAAEVFGTDHLLFGSDWPFPMGLVDPHAQLACFPASLREAILNRRADSRSGGRHIRR